MANSTHKVEVIRVTLEKHPNADSLSLVRPHGGYCVVARTSDWKDGNLAAYVCPDSLVDVRRPEFAFLDSGKGRDYERVKVKRLRGVYSQGLLVPAPTGSQEGDDVAELLGVKHYNPPEPGDPGMPKEKYGMGGEVEKAPTGVYPKYDVDSWRRYKHLLQEGELVVVTEKIHGASSRYVWKDGRLHVGSRTEWKREYPSYDHVTVESLVTNGCEEEKAKDVVLRLQSRTKTQNVWWKAIHQYPDVIAWLENNEGFTLYGELYGQVQSLKYGTSPGEVRLAFFDILSPEGQWLHWEEVYRIACNHGIPWVPTLHVGPYSPAQVEMLAEGSTTIPNADHVREGVVVKPVIERYDERLGRVCLKIVGNGYLEAA